MFSLPHLLGTGDRVTTHWSSCLYHLCAMITGIWLTYTVLGIEPRASYMLGKYSVNWAVSPIPSRCTSSINLTKSTFYGSRPEPSRHHLISYSLKDKGGAERKFLGPDSQASRELIYPKKPTSKRILFFFLSVNMSSIQTQWKTPATLNCRL